MNTHLLRASALLRPVLSQETRSRGSTQTCAWCPWGSVWDGRTARTKRACAARERVPRPRRVHAAGPGGWTADPRGHVDGPQNNRAERKKPDLICINPGKCKWVDGDWQVSSGLEVGKRCGVDAGKGGSKREEVLGVMGVLTVLIAVMVLPE